MFENQDPDFQFVSLMGWVIGAGLEQALKLRFTKFTRWKHVMIIVAITIKTFVFSYKLP